MDEFLENIMKIGGTLALVCLPLGFMLSLNGASAGGPLGLTIGAIGLAIYFITSAILERNS